MNEKEQIAAFTSAAANGQLAKLIDIAKQATPALRGRMLSADDYSAGRLAAENGHMEILSYLIKKVPNLLLKIIQTNSYWPFWGEAANNILKFLQYLEMQAPVLLQKLIQAEDYYAFRWAAANGHFEILSYLAQKAPAHLKMMIQAEHYYAFWMAAANGHLKVMCFIAKQEPTLLKKMIQACDHYAFQVAAENGSQEILLYLEQQAPDLLPQMIQADNFYALRWAAKNSHHHITPFLLKHYACFAYAERQSTGYRVIVQAFVENTLSDLKMRKEQHSHKKPTTPFDLTDKNEAKLCFYIIRNMIRQNSHTLDNDLRFLIAIPAVRALLHESVTSENDANELLRLALHTNVSMAVQILLTVPTVRNLAIQNEFYIQETHADINLAVLVQNKESSMQALTPNEERRLAAVIQQYQPQVQQLGIPHLMNQLRQDLLKRYEANPATIIINDKVMILPSSWSELVSLNLNELEFNLALQAYYKNKDHTAWRYFLIPNPWISLEAAHVEVNEKNPNERNAIFDLYQHLIVILWLAAKDENQPAISGHTVSGRLTHFYDVIAQLERAHNWDGTRIKTDASGAPCLDKEGNVIEEEYDNAGADEPSCHLGIKRRLLQAVIGHPLLQILTADLIKQELRAFIHDHVKQCITKDNRKSLMTSYHNYLDSLDLAIASPLKIFNIKPTQKNQLVESLERKYGTSFKQDLTLHQYLSTTLKKLEDAVTNLSTLDGIVNLSRLLALKEQSQNSKTADYQKKLNQCGGLGKTLSNQIQRLELAQNSYNPYWMNSAKKLKAIIKAVNSLPSGINEKTLAGRVNNPKDALHRALNIQRLSPLTFLGQLSWNQAKTLLAAQEVSHTIINPLAV